jgi:hypothetical protein
MLSDIGDNSRNRSRNSSSRPRATAGNVVSATGDINFKSSVDKMLKVHISRSKIATFILTLNF